MRVSAVVPLLPRLLSLTLALTVGAAVAAACSATPLPGTQYGTYKVTGQTETNSCGPGLDSPDPWVFNAQLSQDGTTIYWSFIDGNAPLSGALVSDGVTLTTSTTANVDATDAGAGPCTMTRADAVVLTFASGSPPPSFTGTITYSFTVPSGSTCTDQLASSGGQYSTLPCTLEYTVTADRQ
jgi:hypothetical protein